MAKAKSPKRLEDLDENFRHKTSDQALQWIDAFDERLALRGLGWLKDNRRSRNFRRLPDRSVADLSEGVQILSHCPAGVFLSFRTDATDISVRYAIADLDLMDHMPATGMSGAELYFREGAERYVAAVARPSLTETEVTRALIEAGPKVSREYRLYLPLYKKVESVALGFSRKAKVEPVPAAASGKPIVFYGTSITQGGCANTAGSDFVAQLGRRLEREVINLGFSGNGRGEPEMARLVRSIAAGLFVLDYAANADPETLERTLPEFVRLIRERHPRTPIALVGNVAFDQSLWSAKVRDDLDRKRDIQMEFYLAAKKAGERHLHFIDGHGLLPIGASGVYVDGVHPTSHGFSLMAERLAPQIARILLGT